MQALLYELEQLRQTRSPMCRTCKRCVQDEDENGKEIFSCRLTKGKPEKIKYNTISNPNNSLCRNYEPSHAKIKVDGKDINTLIQKLEAIKNEKLKPTCVTCRCYNSRKKGCPLNRPKSPSTSVKISDLKNLRGCL